MRTWNFCFPQATALEPICDHVSWDEKENIFLGFWAKNSYFCAQAHAFTQTILRVVNYSQTVVDGFNTLFWQEYVIYVGILQHFNF